MATSNDELRRTVKPGDIVVSLNEIVNRLQSLVSPGVLDGLLSDIVANRRGEVRPGQVITASLMNQVLRQLESLEVRIATLEERSTKANKLELTNIIPSGILRVGQLVQLKGSNFGFTTRSVQVAVGSVQVRQFDANRSNDNQLFFIIPGMSVAAAGEDLTLRVSNGDQSAEQIIRIMPPVVTQSGNVIVQFIGMSPSIIVPNATNPVWFEYKLIANTTLPEMITITPNISGLANDAEWQRQLIVTTDQRTTLQSNQLLLGGGEERVFFVKLVSVPSLPTTGSLLLTVTATSARLAPASDSSREFRISEQISEPNPNVKLDNVSAYPENALSGGDISFTGVNSVELQFYLSFEEAGQYKLTSSTDDSTSWKPEPLERTINVNNVPSNHIVSFTVSAETAAANNGLFKVRITHQVTGKQSVYSLNLIR